MSELASKWGKYSSKNDRKDAIKWFRAEYDPKQQEIGISFDNCCFVLGYEKEFIINALKKSGLL